MITDTLDMGLTFTIFYVMVYGRLNVMPGGSILEDRLTAQQVAAILGISVSAVHRLCTRGTLAFSWFAGRRVIQRSALEALKSSPGYSKRTRKPTLQKLVDQGKIRQGAIPL